MSSGCPGSAAVTRRTLASEAKTLSRMSSRAMPQSVSGITAGISARKLGSFRSAAAFLVCYALAGFAVAPAWPMLMVGAGKAGADVPDTAAGGVMAAGSAGGMLIPFFLGLVQTASGLRASFALLAAIVVLETILLGFSKEFRQNL